MRHLVLLTTGLTALFASSFAGCGGGSSGNDEDFVRDLCEAATSLRTGVQAAVKEASTSTNPDRPIDALAAPLDQFVKDFSDAKPPKDLKDWHHSAADQIQDMVATFKKDRTLGSLTGFADSPVPDPPADAKARLKEKAKDVPECNGVAFLKPD